MAICLEVVSVVAVSAVGVGRGGVGRGGVSLDSDGGGDGHGGGVSLNSDGGGVGLDDRGDGGVGSGSALVNDGVESVVWVSGVVDGADCAVGFDQAVLSLHDVSLTVFGLALLVSGVGVMDSVVELVVRDGLQSGEEELKNLPFSFQIIWSLMYRTPLSGASVRERNW